MEKKEIALSSTIAALYIILVVGLGPLSYLGINFRVANILLGIIPIAGLPAVFGITLGVLVGNVPSPLGPIDMLSAIPSFLGCLSIYYLRKIRLPITKTFTLEVGVLAGLTVYTIIISLWIAFLIQSVFGDPYFDALFILLIGVSAVTIGLGYTLYKVILKYGGEKLWQK